MTVSILVARAFNLGSCYDWSRELLHVQRRAGRASCPGSVFPEGGRIRRHRTVPEHFWLLLVSKDHTHTHAHTQHCFATEHSSGDTLCPAQHARIDDESQSIIPWKS